MSGPHDPRAAGQDRDPAHPQSNSHRDPPVDFAPGLPPFYPTFPTAASTSAPVLARRTRWPTLLIGGVVAAMLALGGLLLARMVSDDQAVQRVENQIEQLGEIDINAQDRVVAAAHSYLELGQSLRQRVRNVGALEEASTQVSAAIVEVAAAQQAIDAVLASRDCTATLSAGLAYQALPVASRAHVNDYAAFQVLSAKCVEEEHAARRNTIRLTGKWWTGRTQLSQGVCSYGVRPTFSNLTDRTWVRASIAVAGFDHKGRELANTAGAYTQYLPIDEAVLAGRDHTSSKTFTLRYNCAQFQSFGVRRVEVRFADGSTTTAAEHEMQMGAGWTKHVPR